MSPPLDCSNRVKGKKKAPKSADLKDGAAEGKHLKSQGARKINPCQNKPKRSLAIKRIVMCA